MRPFTIYHFCKDAIDLHKPLWVNAIVASANPTMIFLLGASMHRRRSESIFQDKAPSTQHVSDFFFLVLLSELGNKDLQAWQDKIETNCRHLGPATVWVLPVHSFKEWLQQGHQFAVQVWQSAIRFHDAGGIAIENIPAQPVRCSEVETEQQVMGGLVKANEFLVGAELYAVRKQYTMAVFMLHQSAEQALISMVKAATGYHANTHSIDRLLRFAELVSYRIRDIFPRQTEQQKRLFSLLQKAYIETRYKNDYKITEEELLALTEKVRNLNELLQEKIKCPV